MKEYILTEYDTPFTALENVVGELIRCKDCQYYLGLAECEMIGFCGGTNFYCGWGKRKKNE